jgi:hypothetical protein
MFGNPLLLTDDGYQISRSVRLRSSASAYFNRTPASATNRKTMTLSTWQKRGEFSSSQEPAIMWAGTNSSNYTLFRWGNGVGNSDSKFFLNLNMYTGTTNINLVTTPLFRDPSGWYHIVLSIDTTQATAANRVRLYINGVEVTSFSSASYPSQNLDLLFNSTNSHEIGRFNFGSYLDGYLTEINLIDGQALTPSSFGETDAITGVWKPKKYVGTYGTNGFFLNFSDNSSNTATTIGKDYSGNGNNWTPNNISVTSGVTYDSMLDVPTLWADGGNGRGNYAVLNPVQNPPSGAVSTAYSNANLTTTLDSSVARSTIGVSSGKWYAEFVITSATLSTDTRFAIEPSDGNTFSGNAGQGRAYSANGNKVFNGSSTAYGSTWTTNDVIGCALDLDNGKVWWSKNGTWQASGDPAAGTGEAYSGLSGTHLFTIVNGNSAVSKTFNANFGQRPFAYTPPTGFKALNTQNLPEPTIKKGNLYFDATTYTGNNSTNVITNSGSMQPDLVWIKSRSSAFDHALIDAQRGVTKWLASNSTAAEATSAAGQDLVSFNSNGFTLGPANTAYVNNNSLTFVGWQWKEGATQGFDIVTYTGTGANRTIAHSLGVAPSMMIVKRRDSSPSSWTVWHSSFSSIEYIYLNLTNAKSSSSGATVWNSTLPTSSVFSLGTYTDVNASGGTHVAYLFSEVAGFSKFGSYTGNGSSDGPFVFTGFRPRWVMVKKTSATDDWVVFDTARDTFNVVNDWLFPNLSNAELTTAGSPDVLSNGFKLRSNSGATNASGASFIFAAFAESPFKTALAL